MPGTAQKRFPSPRRRTRATHSASASARRVDRRRFHPHRRRPTSRWLGGRLGRSVRPHAGGRSREWSRPPCPCRWCPRGISSRSLGSLGIPRPPRCSRRSRAGFGRAYAFDACDTARSLEALRPGEPGGERSRGDHAADRLLARGERGRDPARSGARSRSRPRSRSASAGTSSATRPRPRGRWPRRWPRSPAAISASSASTRPTPPTPGRSTTSRCRPGPTISRSCGRGAATGSTSTRGRRRSPSRTRATRRTVAIASPADLAEVTAPTPVVGSVRSPTLAGWELDFRAEGDAIWLTARDRHDTGRGGAARELRPDAARERALRAAAARPSTRSAAAPSRWSTSSSTAR